jgi:hypothetical protein
VLYHRFVVTTVVTGTSGFVCGVVVAGVVVVVVVAVVGRVPVVVAVVVIVGITTPVGRVPAPGIVVAIAITIVVGVVAIVVAIVIRIVPAAEHIGDVAGLHPHLIAHNHNRVEGGVVGQGEEVGVAVAVVVVRRGHTVGERGESLQTASVGAAVVVHIDVVVDADVATRGATRTHRGVGATHLDIAQDGVDVILGFGRSNHCSNTLLVGLACGCLGGSNLGLGLGQGCTVVDAVEVVGVGCESSAQSYVCTAGGKCEAPAKECYKCCYISRSHHISELF